MALNRGEVWLFDCGMIEKVRPVLILSIPFADKDRAVVTSYSTRRRSEGQLSR